MNPHGHTWYATLHLKSLVGLNAQDMSVEFFAAKIQLERIYILSI
ncbi:MAG: hypothetical protein H6623_05195 [Bdellovibrionaceae bacterium]|nr:hypothetical protein [Pseudobdellovibrionaceae bacterium]